MPNNTPKDNFITSALKTKKRVEGGLEAVGGNIRKNIKQGDADFQSGKAKYYATINPLKGTGAAFKQGYNK